MHLGVLGINWNVPSLLHRDLAKKDRNGASDPFVRVRYNGKTQESTVSPAPAYPIPQPVAAQGKPSAGSPQCPQRDEIPAAKGRSRCLCRW